MKKRLNKKTLCLAAAALTLTAGVSVGSTMAYFTTYTSASGGAAISIGSSTITPDEEVSNMEKRIAVTNTGDKDCFVRVKVFAGSEYGFQFAQDAEGSWSIGDDGYYYCSAIVPAGGTSSRFTVKITAPEEEDLEEFNVIVVQECTAVLYDEEGNPYADWDMILDSSENNYGNDAEEVVE